MINIVIIGRNEADSIAPMCSMLRKQLPNARRIWILDRCSDNSKALLKLLGEEFHTRGYIRNGFGRKTSTNRNYGLGFTDMNSDVLFLDGDRYVVEGSLDKLCKTKNDVTLLKVKNDYRGDDYDEYSGKIVNGFYSCGIFFKSRAIDKILEFQKELFSTKVEKYWGSEDLYLGDVCCHLELKIGFYKWCRLNGGFERKLPDSFESLKKRFELRSKLNVLWI